MVGEERSTTKMVKPKAAAGENIQKDYGIYTSHLEGENEFYTLENNKLKLTISKKGKNRYGRG